MCECVNTEKLNLEGNINSFSFCLDTTQQTTGVSTAHCGLQSDELLQAIMPLLFMLQVSRNSLPSISSLLSH